MSNFAPYSNHGYLSLEKEATPWVAILPTEFLRLLSESIETNFWISPVQEIAGSRERNIRTVQNQVEVSWDVEFYVEPKMIGHFLRGLFGIPTTQILTAWTSFRHVFEVTKTPQTYTFDIAPADSPWVHRYFGVQIMALSFEQDDNKIKCTATLSPRKAFINARVKTAVSSGTTLNIDQTSWLTSSDTILVIQKEDGFTTVQELAITSVDSETQLTTATISTSIDVDDIIVIKRATASYDQDNVLTWLGGSEVFTWDDIDNTTVEKKENFTLAYSNDVEARFFAGLEEVSRFPWDVLVKGYTWSGTLDKFYDSESNLDKLRKNAQIGYRLLTQWETAIEANSTVQASSTFWTTNGFKVEASTPWKAWNDINVTIIVDTVDTLSATKSGNNITIKLASTTSSNNTGTLIAAAVNALSWVDGTAEWTWAEEFTTAEDNINLGFRKWTSTDVVGRDASEVPYIQFDQSAAKFDTFSPNASEDDILMEEIPLTFYKDVESGDTSKKWSTRIYLLNDVSGY